jgi:hypothetical protein
MNSMMTTTRQDTKPRRDLLRVLLTIVAAYLVGRAILEPFVIDMGDPATYRHDWGGPSLIGVLTVHCGAALIVIGYAVVRMRHRVASRGRLTH